MTTRELHKILDDKSRKLSVDELKDIIYELINDSVHRAYQGCISTAVLIAESDAFKTVLCLLDHLEVE